MKKRNIMRLSGLNEFVSTITAITLVLVAFIILLAFPSYAKAGLIPKASWTLKSCDSQEISGEDGHCTNAFDGNTATFWHTKWSSGVTSPPHEIQINMGAVYNVSEFHYLPRQDGGVNGTIKKYDFFVSSDGNTWGAAVASGTWANDATEKVVTFSPKSGKYIRLRANSEVNGNAWTSAAEITAYDTPASLNMTVKVGVGGSVTRASVYPVVTTSGPVSPATGFTTYPYTINNNSSEIFTITPLTGYKLLDVTEATGSPLGTASSILSSVVSGNSLTRSNITQNRSLTFTFQVLPTNTITASVSGTGGTIATPPGAGVNTVTQGNSAIYSFVSNPGFMVNDVLVDGTSVGAVASYPFNNITANHTIVVSFKAAPASNNYCNIPAFLSNEVPPNVMLMMSVENPMTGVGNPLIHCNGIPTAAPDSATPFTCGVTTVAACSGNAALGCYCDKATDACHSADRGEEYTGYFEINKCYTYSGSGASGLFTPSGPVTSGTHQCGGGAWSGNLLNWATTMALDSFRKAFTGGNRDTDNSTNTVLVAGYQNSYSYFPEYIQIDNAELYTPYSGTIYLKRHDNGFSVCKSGASSCSVNVSGANEQQFPVSTATTTTGGGHPTTTYGADGYSLRIKACDATGGVESRCNTITNKPEGILQKYADRMRFALTSFTTDDSETRDGGVLRANMKWLIPTIPYGMKYNDSAGAVQTCGTVGGCPNPVAELTSTGTFVANPDSADVGRSGVINYINKFGYYSNHYKGHDPVSEMYYQTLRYFMNKTPSQDNYCNGLGTSDDGFPVYCNQDKTNALGWRDPFLYPCSKSFVIAINDANPWEDKRIPGTPFGAGFGVQESTDYCSNNTAHPCDSDVPLLTTVVTPPSSYGSTLSAKAAAEYWTNKVGVDEGLTVLSSVATPSCIWDATAANCSGGTNVTGKLGSVILNLGQSYYIAGLAYFAHMNDLRPDFNHCSSTQTTGCSLNADCPSGETCLVGKRNVTTYMIDTQEPAGSMRVGTSNQLYLAAKYGGFEDNDGDGKPYKNTSTTDGCGTSTTANPLCSEWYSEDNHGYPSNYFFASNSANVENGLKYAFNNMMRQMASGTSASILSNSEGSGANILQAVFYPRKIFNNMTEASWIGEVNNMWYYLDPFIGNSSIREDTDYVSGDHQLDLKKDLIAQFTFDGSQTNVQLYKDSNGTGLMDSPQPSGYPLTKTPENTKSIWKAGQLLWERDLTVSASARKIYTTTDGANLTNFSALDTTNTTVQSLLQAGSTSEAAKIIGFTTGTDQSSYRSRTVSWTKSDGTPMSSVWRLGDVISSTPRLQSTTSLNSYGADSPSGYGDSSYKKFLAGTPYSKRGMAYVGANDGMLHAFKLGLLNVKPSGSVKATLSGTNLGAEQWAFIPRNVLPYLKYYTEPKYNHIYSVDGTTNIIDVSVMKPSGCDAATSYWNCTKDAVDGTNWATILLGNMGLGGGSKISTDSTCTDCVRTPTTDPADSTKGLGYSSYFALDITRQDFASSDTLTTTYTHPELGTVATPRLLWEFSHPNLGYSTPGVAVVRINSKTDSAASRKNGRWVGIIPSGPTGPIDTTSHQFKGRSDQNLMIFVIDLKDGTLLSKNSSNAPGPIDTGIPLAFAGPVKSGVIDTDRWNINTAGKGNYQDDAVYFGYTKAAGSGTAADPYLWTKGGVLRIVIPENTDPDAIDTSKWKISKVIDDIGPVTTSIAKLQDRKNHNLWLYFGSGRYFYQSDDSTNQQRIYGVKDLCYKATVARACYSGSDNTTSNDDIDDCLCADSSVSPSSPPSGVSVLDGNNISSALTDQSGSSISDALSIDNGWYVNLATSSGGYGAEKNVTDPSALTNGLVLFTTFMPTTDICSFGGNTYMWAFKYDTGYTPSASSLQGKITIQESTGAFEEKNLATIFNDASQNNRKTSSALTGKPPGDPPSVISKSNLKPVKKIVHIQER